MTQPEWIHWDHQHCWHPFTDQQAWEKETPLFLVKGEGVWLEDSEGNRYIDGNSSIWTNIHGHSHPELNQALAQQAESVSHTSYLGFAHPKASELARQLTSFFPEDTLERVFYSDDGSTAIEVAMKLALQSRQEEGRGMRRTFIAFDQAYHGDTAGAAALGGVPLFFERFQTKEQSVRHVSSLAHLKELSLEVLETVCAVVIEPLIQGVNQMQLWPKGMLRELRAFCDQHQIYLVLDEVMTGFGRTGTMFACQQEGVIPDFLCIAKGLTGGYLPMAATLTTAAVYDSINKGNPFYYGHSYTANQLGCALALKNLDLFRSAKTLGNVEKLGPILASGLADLAARFDSVFEVRQLGLIAGVELRQSDGEPYDPSQKIGAQVCMRARQWGLLTRPILDTVVLMPPLSITEAELVLMLRAFERAIENVCDS